MTPAPTVIKLGGSHAHSPLLRGLLDAISRQTEPTVLVPGGGPFADAVRAAQPAMGFDDDAAHDMALLAMAQYGRALASLGGFPIADTLAAIEAVLARERIPVWLPWPMLRDAPEIPRSWDVTSDSLALWLAWSLGARRVVLVKPWAPASADADIVALGLVDPAFPRFRADFNGKIEIIAASALSGDRLAGIEVV